MPQLVVFKPKICHSPQIVSKNINLQQIVSKILKSAINCISVNKSATNNIFLRSIDKRKFIWSRTIEIQNIFVLLKRFSNGGVN